METSTNRSGRSQEYPDARYTDNLELNYKDMCPLHIRQKILLIIYPVYILLRSSLVC